MNTTSLKISNVFSEKAMDMRRVRVGVRGLCRRPVKFRGISESGLAVMPRLIQHGSTEKGEATEAHRRLVLMASIDSSDDSVLSLVYLIGTYPLLTTTFIDREIRALEARGVDVKVVSMRRPTGRRLSAVQESTVSGVTYVLPVDLLRVVLTNFRYLVREPATYLATLYSLVKGSHATLKQRFKTSLHFAMGVHVTGLVEPMGPSRVHAHFVDRATTVAMVVSKLLDVPYSATAHANDIYVDPVLLAEKIGHSDFVVTCTGYNADHLATLGDENKIHLIHHGLDLSIHQLADRELVEPPVVLAVGQLKEKKGFRHLIEACRLLVRDGVEFRCEIVGEGVLRDMLQDQIDVGGLGDCVRLLGAADNDTVIERMRAATVFALPSVVTAEGDRDGIPNVILEAMAVGLPVVSTRVSAIPEVVIDSETGILVEPEDPEALATALGRLLSDSALRDRLGRKARALVERDFEIGRNVAQLLLRFSASGR